MSPGPTEIPTGRRTRWPSPRRADGLLAGLVATALIGVLMLMLPLTDGDYSTWEFPGADNAGPPLQALIHGHLSELPRLQTVMGLTSILWRAPVLAVGTALGASEHLGYLIGVAACLAPVVGLVMWAAQRSADPQQRRRALVAAAVIILGPATARAAIAGHPEELLTAGLAVAAVLFAQADRRIWTAVALGLSLGSKEWAVVAIPAVLLALTADRRRVLAGALAIAAAMTLPLPLIDPTAFHHADLSIGPLRSISALSLWWPVSPTHRQLPFGMERGRAFAIALTLVAGIAWSVGHRLRRRVQGRPPAIDPLAMLILAGTFRCLCDPMDCDYYLVAVTIPLAVWEVGTLRRMPVVSLLVWAALGICYSEWGALGTATSMLSDPVAFSTFLACACVLGGYLTWRTFIPAAPQPPPQPTATSAQPVPRRSSASVSAPTFPPLSTTPTR